MNWLKKVILIFNWYLKNISWQKKQKSTLKSTGFLRNATTLKFHAFDNH